MLAIHFDYLGGYYRYIVNNGNIMNTIFFFLIVNIQAFWGGGLVVKSRVNSLSGWFEVGSSTIDMSL